MARMGEVIGCMLMLTAGCGEVVAQAPAAPEPVPDAATPVPVPDAAGRELTINLFHTQAFIPGDTGSADLVAVQDGDGSWTTAAGENGVYHVRLMSTRYGVAIGCRSSLSSSITIVHRTVDDGLDVNGSSCGRPVVRINVNLHNIPAGALASIATDSSIGFFSSDGAQSIGLVNGPTEIVSTLMSASGSRTSKIIRIPTSDYQAGQTIDIDFATQGVAPEEHPVSVAVAAGTAVSVNTRLVTPHAIYLLGMGSATDPPPATFQLVPSALRQPDDLFDVIATTTVGTQLFETKSTTIRSRSPQTLAFEFSPSLEVPTPVLLGTPYLRPVFSFVNSPTPLPLSGLSLLVSTRRTADNVNHQWTVSLSPSWSGDAAVVQYVYPDLSGVSGFSPDFVLFDRERIDWRFTRFEYNGITGDGRVTRSNARSGTMGVYCGNGVVEPPETCEPPNGTTCSATCTKI